MTVQVAIARDYFPAYARLPRKAQRKADEFLRKFTSDPKQAAIHYEPIQSAHDRQLRSVRIGDDYRAIVRAPERGDVFLLLWVDHHDEAYRWAASKQTAVHPVTGTLQLFDLDAAAQVVTSLGAEPGTAGTVSAQAAAKAAPSSSPVDVEGPRLFAALSDDDLFRGGVPRVLIPAVRAVATDEELDQLAPHLPAEAAEVLTGLAAGFSLDAILEEILGRDAPPSPAAAPKVDPADVAAALGRPSTQQQFRVVDADFDLETALANPLDVWRVYLHPRQRTLARARTKGPMRVTGGAGTGKTVVALHRAAFLVREVYTKPDDRVLFTTFTVNLALDLRRQIEKLLEPHELARVEIRNIDALASEYLRSRGEPMRLATSEAQERAWSDVMNVYAVDGFGLEFCKSEWRDVVQAQDLRDEEAYVRAVRLSRGLPLGRRERRLLWPLLRAYRQELQDRGIAEAVEILRHARELVEAAPGPPRYRAVVVDETQDFSLEALRLVRALAGPERPDDLFLVGDAHQRIYGRPVALGSAGINVRGRRSQELRLNYRTTAAICRWSLGALGREEVDDLDEGVASRRGHVSLREGQPPSVHRFEDAAEETAFVVAEVKRLLAAGTPPEAICITARRSFALRDRFLDALEVEHIPADILDREEPRHPSVRLATMHRIKGLEFPVVFVVSVNEDEVPLRTPELASDDPVVKHRTEVAERCLLYVAASRARDVLYVTSHGAPSPILEGMGEPPKAVRCATVPPVSASVQPAALERAGEGELAESAQSAAQVEPTGAPETEEGAESSTQVVFSVEATAGEGPATPAERTTLERAFATPLDALSLPTRLQSWADRKGLGTLADLARIPPRDLLPERNLGRKSIFDARTAIEARLGCTWEEAALLLATMDRSGTASVPDGAEPGSGTAVHEGAAASPPGLESDDWDVFRSSLPDALRATSLDAVDLPARVRTYSRAEKLETVGELATRSRRDLLAVKSMGRATFSRLVPALRAHMARVEAGRQRTDAGFLESWKGLLQEQDAVRRLVVTLRAGFGSRRETLQAIGEMLGVSRERARQLEGYVIQDLRRERAWLDEVKRRIEAAMKDGAVSLESLAADPWWSAVVAVPEALDYFGERLLDSAVRVIEVDEVRYLAPCTQARFEEAWSDLRDRASKVPLPAPLDAFSALADALVPAVGRFLADVLFDRLRELLHVEDAGSPTEAGSPAPRVVGFGGTNAAAVLAILRASPAPMRIEDLYARVGRFHNPEEMLFFDRGLVGMEQHFPDFRQWIERVTPPALDAMQREAPERQWLSSELIEDVRESIELPDWLDHWHLAALLRKSGRLRYLGRNRFSLLEAPDEGRIYYHEELARLLREHGGPMLRSDLIAELGKRTTLSDFAVTMSLTRPMFLRCDAEHIGLLDRDLPGGAPALAEALDHIASVLEHRQRGLGAAQVKTHVSRLSAEHARWTEEMSMSALRTDPRFRLSQAGAAGLAQWESVRVPPRLEIVRQCLEESGWHVTVEAVQRRIEAYYGSAPDRVAVGAHANRFGAVLRGEWLERGEG